MLCAFAGAGAARKYFQIFGVVYLLVALLGFYYGNNPLMGMVEHNKADIWLHIAIAAVALFLGFTGKSDASSTTTDSSRNEGVELTAERGPFGRHCLTVDARGRRSFFSVCVLVLLLPRAQSRRNVPDPV